MSAAFTPGPWSASNGNLVRVNAASRHGGWKTPVVVCGVHRIGVFTSGERPGETLANARLIAAAPELYDALENIIFGISQGNVGKDVISAGVIVLAKARGEAA